MAAERWDNNEPLSICQVEPGDLVTVAVKYVSGTLAGIAAGPLKGLSLHLLYRAQYSGLHGGNVIGNDPGPVDYRIDGPIVWAPHPGTLFIDGNTGMVGDVSFTKRRCAARPKFWRPSLSYYSYTGDMIRPRGAVSMVVPTAISVDLSYDGVGTATTALTAGSEYSLGMYSRITVPASSNLHFYLEL